MLAIETAIKFITHYNHSSPIITYLKETAANNYLTFHTFKNYSATRFVWLIVPYLLIY